MQGCFSGIEAAEFEELFNLQAQELAVFFHYFQVLPYSRQVEAFVFQYPLQGTEDERKRGAELMADVGKKLRLHPVQLLKFAGLLLDNLFICPYLRRALFDLSLEA